MLLARSMHVPCSALAPAHPKGDADYLALSPLDPHTCVGGG